MLHIASQSAKQLLPLAEEYEMFRLRRDCEIVLYHAYEQLRKDHRLGHMPPDINEEYLIIADRYKFEELLQMCIAEYVHCTNHDVTKGIVNTETVSERVKLVILERKLSRLNAALERERKYKYDMENKLGTMSPKSKWTNKFGLY
ncbi:hypothetical protein DPMN_067211 [Dreissena polymorpha]|uniref:Uncharacterized protein n=1 Tax=Dreissena polymorpha TaxID=45954 RepID=A0A9D4BSM8_DREPO|nr:hypothetical protein DPMN_067211 [Dreissena polymorpha]